MALPPRLPPSKEPVWGTELGARANSTHTPGSFLSFPPISLPWIHKNTVCVLEGCSPVIRPPAGVHTPDWAFTAVLEGERNPSVAVSWTRRAAEVHTAMAGLQEWGLPCGMGGGWGNGSPQQHCHLVERLKTLAHWVLSPRETPGPSQPQITDGHV